MERTQRPASDQPAADTAPCTPAGAPPALRPWRAPTLERLPLTETRNGVVAIPIDGGGFENVSNPV